MSTHDRSENWGTSEAVDIDLQRQRHLFLKLAENAFLVAESLRDNYFKNTAAFITALRRAMMRQDSILATSAVDDLAWDDCAGEVVTFVDGGVGQVQISSQVPILLRVGSYCVRTGERQLASRESFGYYPVILGDLEGGSKERKDYIDIVRISAELLGGLSALDRTQDLNVLMFHGPLMYLVEAYAGHAPFTERDIDLFLGQYGTTSDQGRDLKEEFLRQARIDIYPAMTDDARRLVERRLFEPLAWIAFLYRSLIRVARERPKPPVIVGVVERGDLREFIETVLLRRVFRGLREKQREDYFNTMYGRTDLVSEKALLDRLGYTDSLLMGMLLRPGEASEPWEVGKFAGLRGGQMGLPGEASTMPMRWEPLQPPSPFGFPPIVACYVHVSETTEPIRVEVFKELGIEHLREAARRAYLYARLLPGYGFPVGLDIADKYAKVPTWLTDAYGKIIRHQLGVSLQQGEISDADMRRILVQAIYMTHRDWLFRPQA
ncbi:MAG: hypothetical protein DCC58_02165 [Chloroflexi bacterium]|nr:MAG: hypothetical protein DCC58_02165 [Chloroflexota bacterium]